MHVVIFEGSRWSAFAPVSLGRPVFTLMSGSSTLLEKQVRHLKPSRLTLWVRPALEDYCRQRLLPGLGMPTEVNRPLDDEPALLVSGRMLQFSSFDIPTEPCVAAEAGDDLMRMIRSAYLRRPGLTPRDALERTEAWSSLLELPPAGSQGRMAETLWDLIHYNEESLVEDAIHRQQRAHPHPTGPYHLINEAEVWIGQDVKLDPGTVLDASRGPVLLGDQAVIGANSVIQGPCSIADHSIISPLTLIRPGVSIGPFCKVGGEVSNSILLGYSSKMHEGFLGDSYLGKWVNLGSGTTTSNLKNTYGEVTVKCGSREIPTGRRFLGSLMGDHTRTAIGTRMMAGSYLGYYSSVASSSIAPRFVPSFSFLTDRGMAPYRIDKAVEVARHVYSRRDRTFSDMDERLLRHIAETAREVEWCD